MSLTRIVTASLFAVALGGFALHIGCSSDDEPECASDAQCRNVSTACAAGACREGKCVAQPLADGTRVADQTPVKDKLCVKLECKAGVAVEAPDNAKTAPDVECQRQNCENMVPKTENLLDGVPCRSSMGTCQGGMCVPSDSGPIGTTDTAMSDSSEEVGDDAAGDSETDAAGDSDAAAD